MKRVMKAVTAVMTVLVFAVGCTTIEGAITETVGATSSRATERALADSMSGMTDEVTFHVAYMQVFFLGGYGDAQEDYEEGEGTTWEIETTEPGERSTSIGERALLRWNDDGSSWWYLRLEAADEEQEFEYEVRVNEDYQAEEVYLKDPETGEIRHRVFDVEDADDWESPDPEEEEEVFTDGDLGEYRQDRVTVTVGAGTYDADRYVYEDGDDESGDEVEYRWWMAEEVPGNVVLYEWENLTESSMLRGELIAIGRDYTTKFGAY
ncbi:MAG: hypothetical protein ACOCXE_01610 [Spirochaetota bacterium]